MLLRTRRHNNNKICFRGVPKVKKKVNIDKRIFIFSCATGSFSW